MISVAGPAYVKAVLALYLDLPDTPSQASAHDQAVARALFAQGVPLAAVESGLLLGSLRRRVRPAGTLPLPPVRSLAYFQAVIAEVQLQTFTAGYLDYLRSKLRDPGKALQRLFKIYVFTCALTFGCPACHSVFRSDARLWRGTGANDRAIGCVGVGLALFRRSVGGFIRF